MLSQTAQRLGKVPGYLERHWLWMMAALLTTMTVMAARKKSWKLSFLFPKKARYQAILAKHYYGRMLQVLDKNGYERHQQQTPYEFLTNLREADFPAFPEAELLTQTFCESNYGKKPVSSEME